VLLSTLGQAYLRLPDAPRAISNLSKAVALDPKNGSYHYQLSRAYLKAGLQSKADAETKLARTLLDSPAQGNMEAVSRDENAETITEQPH